ncbi:MAG: hypothetical protein D6798_00545 [Deltaproteobacteria bacterium]|nr:MAG: hypothetical protein D6798_00545 [Deltaproteobacteria bacterium]
MQVDGSIDMDVGLLEGRQAFVMGCGEIVPVAPDLSFHMDVNVQGCLFSVVLIDAQGSVALGTGELVGVDGPVPESGPIQRDDVVLQGPSDEDFLPWSEQIQRAERSLQVMDDACTNGILPDDCESTMVAPLREDLAWMEELTPLMLALSDRGTSVSD